MRAADRFLRAGDKVKVSVRFRGREIVHADLAKTKLDNLAVQLQEVAIVERAPKLEGRQMVAVLAPRTDQKTEKKKAENVDLED